MSNIEIILFAVVFALVGIKLYRKYVKKENHQPVKGHKKGSDSSFSSHFDVDDYEPYSGKKE